jgi:TrpR-related protein YerC/YecD
MPTKKRFTDDSYRKEPWFRSLCDAIRSNKTEEEMMNFLRDIATLSELQAWGERLEVAKQLVQGLSYRQVAANTGASTTTVTRVAKFIENGCGGYRKVLHAHRHHRAEGGSKLPVSQESNSEGAQSEAKKTGNALLQKYLQKR